jgi:CHAT domain-containing protein
MKRAVPIGLLALLAVLAAGIGAAAPRLRGGAPDIFVLGRDATGEPCAATRNWRDARLGDAFDAAWGLTCRGVAASRLQGYALRLAPTNAAAAAIKDCGAAVIQTIAGIGAVETRACYDETLAAAAVRVRFRHDGHLYVGASAQTALGPLEALLRAVARVASPPADRDVVVKPTLVADRLLQPARIANAKDARAVFDASSALQASIQLNHRGLYVEASRLLNDALSRLDNGGASLTRVELELEAGLADSNIRQFDAADDHFSHAAVLLAANAGADRAAALEAKRAVYRGLDLLNRRQWADAFAAMGDTDARANPLLDPATLSRLNQAPPGAGVSAALSAVDGAQLARLLLEAQRRWARSVALLALGRTKESNDELDRAAEGIATLQRSVDSDAIVAIKSRVQRQYARVAVRDGKIDVALSLFDCAIASLQGQAPSALKPCPLDRPGRRASAPGNSEGLMIAETELERTSILARRPSVPMKDLLTAYDAGVDALIASTDASGIVPSALESYLETLAKLYVQTPTEELAERFFRAVQSVGEPAIARQLAQLQSVITADGTLGAKVRDRGEVERQIVQLRYAISSTPADDAATLASLETQRRTAEGKLGDLNNVIASDSRYRAVDDRPATIRQMRAALRPGEIYVKVSRLRGRAWATVIDDERTWIYPLAGSSDDVDRTATLVLNSIRDNSDSLPIFDVVSAHKLFLLVAGPAEPALLRAKAIVFDLSGALQNLPASVMVADEASVKAYLVRSEQDPNDYSHVDFLAGRAEISNALSPRSFLIARALPESSASKPFIGFGQNAPPIDPNPRETPRPISFGVGCSMTYLDLSAIMQSVRPVSAAELGIAAIALGDPDAPEVIGRAFTDTAVMAASDAGDYARYQVIHFATHGLPESHWGCSVVPPSLLTTLAAPAPPDQMQSDGLLTFSEIARLRLDANLVVLLACETAAGVSTRGGRLGGQDESAATLDGLVRAFITANARSVLATYWKVPDGPQTVGFVRTFYVTGRTETIGAALRRAQTGVIAQPAVSHPYFWAPFFLVGDASKTMLSRPVPTTQRIAGK